MTVEESPSLPPPPVQEYTSEDCRKKTGSGLALFFQDFLPPFQHCESNAYFTSLSEVPTASRAFLRHSKHNGEVGNEEVLQLTYREWRNEQKQTLMDFLVKRLTAENSDDEDLKDGEVEDPDSGREDGQDDNGMDDTFFETQPETQGMFETQPETQPMPESRTEESGSPMEQERPKKRQKQNVQKPVPHIDETLHDVSKLEYLDLYTHILNLPLCRVIKVWKKRDTKRGGTGPFQHLVEACPKFQHGCGIMPRIPFKDMVEDGPVASAFRTVLSMEVEQLKLADGNDLVTSSFQTSKKNLRIKLFFYNSYAEKLAKWIDRQRKQRHSSFILSLSQIPAHCIFPRAVDPQNWMECHNMVNYCLCIGDTSSAKTISDGAFIRFDNGALQIHMASQSISKDPVEGTESTVLVHELVLSQQICDEGYFLSSSSESDDVAHERQRIVPIQDAWYRYVRQQQGADQNNASKHVHQTERSIGNSLTEQTQINDTETVFPETVTGKPMRISGNNEQSVEGSYQCGPMTFRGNAQRHEKHSTVEYVKLSELRGILDRSKERGIKRSFVNIYGLVLGFTSPSQTRRGDWMMTAMLIDESYTTPITIVMFCREPALLPKLLLMGDVLRVHRAELSEWGNEVQILAMKFASSFVVVRNTPENGWIGVPSASNFFTFNPSDERRSQILWKWGQNYVRDFPTINKDHSFTLAEMAGMNNEDEENLKDRDITAMVAGIYRYPLMPSGITPRGMLRIWDGTGIPPSDPFPVRTIFSQQAERNGDPPPEALEELVKIVQKLQQSSEDLVVPLSFCGRVANVLIWEEVHWTLLKEHVQLGTFIRLRNVDIRRWQYNQFRSLMIHSKTWLTPLPHQNFEVRELLLAHNQRVLRGDYNPKAGILPRSNENRTSQASSTSQENYDESTESDLKQFVDQEELGKFTGPAFVKVFPYNLPRSELLRKLERGEGARTPIIFEIKDNSTTVIALASEAIRQKLYDLLLDTSKNHRSMEIFNEKDTYSATVRSVDWNGQRYFVLNELLPIIGD
ncbi:telomeric single stranded DNA binding POT1/CDC13-containing protein [Nitzschia inconspicua]|uniref:Telomeric single stranded DNA binding POT1/CDC13-containing protein n=1 Tax=Nitzschia inconspicua TaxID=303405 RepID=A0A9K3LVK1_9STRA|nr:telomeric single stranded DNA binding POT1/CDC13-containing protein [Nitzschia inconspicua]